MGGGSREKCIVERKSRNGENRNSLTWNGELSSCVQCQGISSGTPGSISSHHGVEDDKDFMHTSDKSYLFEFTGMDETFIECFDNGVVTDSREGRHV